MSLLLVVSIPAFIRLDEGSRCLRTSPPGLRVEPKPPFSQNNRLHLSHISQQRAEPSRVQLCLIGKLKYFRGF